MDIDPGLANGEIYLDYNVTTSTDPRGVEATLPHLTTHANDPCSTHQYGTAAADALTQARERVARLIGSTGAAPQSSARGCTDAAAPAGQVPAADRRPVRIPGSTFPAGTWWTTCAVAAGQPAGIDRGNGAMDPGGSTTSRRGPRRGSNLSRPRARLSCRPRRWPRAAPARTPAPSVPGAARRSGSAARSGRWRPPPSPAVRWPSARDAARTGR